jgi:hypothetical protein
MIQCSRAWISIFYPDTLCGYAVGINFSSSTTLSIFMGQIVSFNASNYLVKFILYSSFSCILVGLNKIFLRALLILFKMFADVNTFYLRI